MRAFDWSSSLLGPISNWPQVLKTSLSISLSSRFPLLIWWGPDLVMLYNDAYRQFLGIKHPQALGQRGRECWAEIWPIVGPMLERVLQTGEATWSEDLLLQLERNGYPEECYFTFSYSPLRDDAGEIRGVFTPVAETSEKVIGERRLRTLRDLAARCGEAQQVAQACRIAAETLAKNQYDVPFSLLYLLDEQPARARLAGSAGIAPGLDASPEYVLLGEDTAAWPFLEAARTSKPVLVERLSSRFRGLPTGAWDAPPDGALVLPITPPGRPISTGWLVAALSPRKRLDQEYRTFLDLVAGQVGAMAAEALAVEEERKSAETLRASEERYRLLFEACPAGYVRINREGRVDAWNPAAERIFGWTAAEAQAQSSIMFLVPKALWPLVERLLVTLPWGAPSSERTENGSATRLPVQRSDRLTTPFLFHPLAIGEPVTSVNENVTKDGRTITCDWFNIPLTDAAGNANGYLSLVQDITGRSQAEKALRESEAHAAVLDERNRMAREIHDTLAQAFTGILMQVGAAERLQAEEPGAALRHLQSIRETAREGLSEVRRSMLGLRPRALEAANLAAALERLVLQLDPGRTRGLQFHLRGTERTLPPDVADHFLRIGQEAVTNALRHADASTIRVELRFTAEDVRLRIADDGKGFSTGAPAPADGFGLTGIRERAGLLGAALSVTSRPTRGTCVELRWPAPKG